MRARSFAVKSSSFGVSSSIRPSPATASNTSRASLGARFASFAGMMAVGASRNFSGCLSDGMADTRSRSGRALTTMTSGR
jgi:hypothetical protein